MRKITNREYADYRQYTEDLNKGRVLTIDHIRSICNGCGNDPKKIGEAILEKFEAIQTEKKNK